MKKEVKRKLRKLLVKKYILVEKSRCQTQPKLLVVVSSCYCLEGKIISLSGLDFLLSRDKNKIVRSRRNLFPLVGLMRYPSFQKYILPTN